MKEKQPTPPNHPEVAVLFSRLSDLTPREMAEALCQLEILKTFPRYFASPPPGGEDQSRLFFSRGIKKEMEGIYLGLARHLEARSLGSQDLMNAIFEFLERTLHSLIKIPHLISMN